MMTRVCGYKQQRRSILDMTAARKIDIEVCWSCGKRELNIDVKEKRKVMYPTQFKELYEWKARHEKFASIHPCVRDFFQTLAAGDDFHPYMLTRIWSVVRTSGKFPLLEKHCIWLHEHPAECEKSAFLGRMKELLLSATFVPTATQLASISKYVDRPTKSKMTRKPPRLSRKLAAHPTSPILEASNDPTNTQVTRDTRSSDDSSDRGSTADSS
jgi:hypothetical protein